MLKLDLVSIIMPTYNCGGYIAESIRSVLAQTYSNWELIIIDDSSTDNTKTVVDKFVLNDSRIKYYCLEVNSGAAIARNMALKLAKGRWIAFLDSDDLWKAEKLEHQIRFMELNRYSFSYHEYSEIDEFGCPLNILVSGKKRVNRFDMRACCWPGCLSVMYDAHATGLIQIENVKKNNDTALWLRIITKADCFLLSENLGFYRRRIGSITPTKISTKIKWHYILFRKAEKMNSISACFWMCMNILGNSYKKIFYVKHIR
ncbi:MAG: glycosyltransferase family 2 protein [Bacteroidales bacterium]|nr:glycosyltransferase family 2 protein [Bacteroidales bacterium]